MRMKVSFIFLLKKPFNSIAHIFLDIFITVFFFDKCYFFSVWKAFGVSNSQICRDMMYPMSQEFVTELDENEGKLNQEIDGLLDGINFHQPMSQEKHQSMSQEKSSEHVPSTFPEENRFNSVQHDNINRNKNEENILDGIYFHQYLSQQNTSTSIPSSFPEENGNTEMEYEDSITCIPSTFPEENGNTEMEDEKISSPILLIDSITCIPSTFPEENGNTEMEDEKISSPILLTQEVNEKETSEVPVIQPFTSSEEKSPLNYEDPMDILEEKPIADVGDTYLRDEVFNQKYPQHPIDVSILQLL